jgi:hypothetical protein
MDIRDKIPASASSVYFEFGLLNAGDDGWWAFDTTMMFYLSTVLGDMNISGFIDNGDIGAFALAMRSTDAYRDEYFGEFPATRGSQDGLLDFDDIPWFVEILNSNGVATSSAEVMAAIQGVPEPPATMLALIALTCVPRYWRR